MTAEYYSDGMVNTNSPKLDFKKTGLFYLKCSVVCWILVGLVFLSILPEPNNYIADPLTLNEYLASGYIPIVFYIFLNGVMVLWFFFTCQDRKIKFISFFQLFLSLGILLSHYFVPVSKNQDHRYTQCLNTLINLDSQARDMAKNLSGSWLGYSKMTAKSAEIKINQCSVEIDKALSRISHKIIEISKPTHLIDLSRMSGRKLNGIVFSVSQEDKLTSCFQKLQDSGKYGDEVLNMMLSDLKKNAQYKDPDLVISHCEANVALLGVQAGERKKLDYYWNK